MTGENKPDSVASKGKKRKYLARGKSVRKGPYPLRPGVQGFFITCDGGRERQAAHEALNLLDTFYEELVHGKESHAARTTIPSKPLNKIIKFKDSDSSSGEDECEDGLDTEKLAKENDDSLAKRQHLVPDASIGETTDPDAKREEADVEKPTEEIKVSHATKQSAEYDGSKCDAKDSDENDKSKDKDIDDLIEDELKELGERGKRRFASLDSGCNGCIFIQMHKRVGDPGPAAIVQRMIGSAASSRKHMSRFILRVVPAEMTCYASEEEISKAIKPLIAQYFPNEGSSPQKFAVLYEARSNTGIERMTIINAVAKSVPKPHKVDLKNPDKTIIVQIARTICIVGVVERYKELAKYNLRQLTTPLAPPQELS